MGCANGAAIAGDDAGVDWPQWRGPDRTGRSDETGWSPVARAERLQLRQRIRIQRRQNGRDFPGQAFELDERVEIAALERAVLRSAPTSRAPTRPA